MAILAKPVVAQTPPALWVATPGDASLPSREPVVQAAAERTQGRARGRFYRKSDRPADRYRLPSRQRQALAAEIGRIQGNISALELGMGRKRWIFQTGDAIRAAPGIEEGYLIVAS